MRWQKKQKNLNQIGVILLVNKENGELVFSMRSKSSSYLPHPVLSKGQGVKVAGTLEKQGNVWVVTNDSGHFKPSAGIEEKMKELLGAVSDEIESVGIPSNVLENQIK